MRGRASGGRGAVGAEARDDVAGRQGKAQMKKGGKKDSAGSSEQSLSDGSGAGSSFPFEKSGRNDGSSVSGGNLSGDDRESSVGADSESNLSDGGSSGPSRGAYRGRMICFVPSTAFRVHLLDSFGCESFFDSSGSSCW